jgi:NTP pyrophosphatase (non-canonical NTP hydrolase)
MSDQATISMLRDALVGLVGSSDSAELEQMKQVLLTVPTPSSDTTAAINGISALLAIKDVAPDSPALASILEERRRQTKKWGEQNHTLGNWGLILMEEVGEWSEAALHTQFGGPKARGLRNEIVQVGAVALQIVEWLDGKSEKTPAVPSLLSIE